MDELTKIAYNCKKATYLMEKQDIGKITLREKLELKIHLAGCRVCRVYQQQSTAINRMIKSMFHQPIAENIKLDDEFKNELQHLIDEQLEK
ncbi:hypothetical protein SNE26_28460 [Mucilaginibacter sp. cycad4]|uniref:hypothetical protein n=1 Tax=Mucilaginibacter sp. cycad4 TaxID=3342096 RepID=UPI002AAB4E1E|nr:hypothetical protein [Mucilaginibacter gossypii]WPU99946.1 hypothetical protein SNE26_28460 [Mucilaginibacter gossypii]